MTIRTIFALTDVISGVVLIAISLPILFNKIPPNYLYGVRTPKAFLSDENWYLINRNGAKCFISWALVLVVLGGLKFFVPWDEMQGAGALIWMFGPILLCTVAPLVQVLVYSWRL